MRAPAEPLPRPRRSLFAAGLLAVVGIAILCGLGTWQLRRLSWKEGLIDTLQRRLTAAPAALPAPAQWSHLNADQDEFRRVRFTAVVASDQEAMVYTAGSAFRSDVSGPGYWVFAPAKLPDGSTVVVNRGFVPEGMQDPKTRPGGAIQGTQEIIGAMRWPEAPTWLTPAGNPANNLWFARDQRAIAAAKGWGPVAPFFIDQEAPVPPGGWPRPGPLTVHLRNDHLQYAITWFGLALVLAGMFGAWAWSRR